ncbi:uncharacterized protein LOC112845087 [Oreochromis niloticus]|uniref:uncharacterized protein LOC112845087 n=1 Tax=Oreochromis niloticus TaxID=8128 RepID=UPI000DF4B87E|nr:uncharacterized protein LOC112845087 [Oreochromis niloticus]
MCKMNIQTFQMERTQSPTGLDDDAGYSPTTNDSDPCNERTQKQTVSREKRSTKSHLQPPKGNSWYDQLNASATDANRINCVVCAEARPKLKIVGYPIPNGSLTDGYGVGWGAWSATIGNSGANMTQVHPLDCLLMHNYVPHNKTERAFLVNLLQTLETVMNTSLRACAPKEPIKNLITLPVTPPELAHNMTMVCLWRLRVPEKQGVSFVYPNKTRHFNTDTTHCSEIWSVVGYGNEYSNWRNCKNETVCSILGPKIYKGSSIYLRAPNNTRNDSRWGRAIKSILVPKLTRPIPGLLWLCNGTLKQRLPANWTGICGIVTLAQEILIQIPKTHTHASPCSRRSLVEDSGNKAWIDAIGVPRGIPREYKAQSEVAAGFASLLPIIQVNKNVAWINYVYYNQQRHLNLTNQALKLLGEQLSATSLMTVQNRMALDMLLAERGGVCAMFGDMCCTFIPNNTAPGGSFEQTMKMLQDLQVELKENAGTWSGLDEAFQNMFGGWADTIKVLAAILCSILVMLAIIVCCIVPCFKALIKKVAKDTATGIFLAQAYSPIATEEEEDCV